MTRYRRIERSESDLVKPWPFLDQLLLALATLALMGQLFMAIGHLA